MTQWLTDTSAPLWEIPQGVAFVDPNLNNATAIGYYAINAGNVPIFFRN